MHAVHYNLSSERLKQVRKPVIGVLLVHGLNGSRDDMQEIHDMLLAQDIISINMLLPGHGTHVSAMLQIGWPEWSEAVLYETRQLKQRCDLVFLVGHSLGGAICLHVSAYEEVAGVVAMCAPICMPFWMEPAVRFARQFTPMLPSLREDIHDIAVRRRSARDVHRWTVMAPVHSMLRFLPTLRTELPRITVPALIMVALQDHVVPARDGRTIYRLLGSREKYLVTFHHSYHVIMKDYERADVYAKILAFIQHYACHATTKGENL